MAKKTPLDFDATPPGYSASAFLGRPLERHAKTVNPAIIEKLAEVGISDTEEFLAVAAIEELEDYLLEFLEVSKTELDAAVREARKAVPESIAMEMAAPDPYDYGLGALPPTEEIEAENAAQAAELALPFAGPLPTSENLIAKMPPIRYQGPRGTCVAFTLTAIHEYARQLTQGDLLSEQHLYYETKLIDGIRNTCGTFQAKAAMALANTGQCSEINWPYNPNNPCNNHGPLPPNARQSAQRLQLVGLVGDASRNVQWIKANLAAKKPVGISIPVYNSSLSSSQVRKTGKMQMRMGNEPEAGGHAVCLVGYQDTPQVPGGGYFILRNSWGTSWGSQCPYGAGYGGIPYQYITNQNREAFTLAAMAAEPCPPVVDEPRSPEAARTITLRIKGNVNIIVE